jgi:hypothetical protein
MLKALHYFARQCPPPVSNEKPSKVLKLSTQGTKLNSVWPSVELKTLNGTGVQWNGVRSLLERY